VINGREVVIIDAVRTPIGKVRADIGYYRETHPQELLAACYGALVDRAGIQPGDVDDVVAGCVQQVGDQSWNVARNAWLYAGFPVETPASTVDRQCGSGQQAVNFAALLIASGDTDVAIGAGVEHLSRIPMFAARTVEGLGTAYPPALLARHGLVDQGISGELIAEKWRLSREHLDEIALRSHTRAAAALDAGRFDDEIVPMQITGSTLTSDQTIRKGTTQEALAELKPAFKENGRLTAGNSSQLADGAGAVLLMAEDKAAELGVKPRARIIDQTTVGCDPVLMLEGPIPATRKILARNNMTLSDIDLIEINEAFSSVVAAWEIECRPDMDRVNVNGGAIALGHPLGATGARLITTIVHELERADKEFGLVTICCGGGLGTATLIQRA
jgi:acetyl-CoA acyltransferase